MIPLADRPDRVRFVGAQGVRLIGDRWLPADSAEGGIVLFLHGGGQTRHSWTRTARYLSEHGWTAVTVDARGHGDSHWAPRYSLELFAGDLESVLCSLGGDVVVVGASLGGRTALHLAGSRSDLFAGLVLVDITHRVDRREQRRIRDFLAAAPDGFVSLNEAAAAIDTFHGERRRNGNVEGLRKNLRLRDDGRWYWHWDPAFVTYADDLSNSDEHRLAAMASQIDTPTLIIRGARSEMISAEAVQELRGLIPGSTAVEVDAGHMIAGDDNGPFAAALGSFLKRVLV